MQNKTSLDVISEFLGTNDKKFMSIVGLDDAIALSNKIAEYEGACPTNYTRIGALTNIETPEEIAKFTKQYEDFVAGSIVMATDTEKKLCEALTNTIELFKKHKANASESIIKNFVVKLFYWCTKIPSEIMENGGKIVYTGKLALPEFLFLNTISKCSVGIMLICDTVPQISAELLDITEKYQGRIGEKLSVRDFIKIAPQAPSGTRERRPLAPRIAGTDPVPPPPPVRNPQPTQPPRVRDENSDHPLSMTHNSASVPNLSPISSEPVPTSAVRPEKSYEELARYAKSVVMIEVYDADGKVMGTGSGVIISSDGYILTNCHVVAGGSAYGVHFEDSDTIYRCDALVKYHQNFDLAILQITAPYCVPIPIYSGTMSLVRGQKVVAIGSPLGLFNTVSDGIISGIRQTKFIPMIQYTAAATHGSSGGAVLNMQGEVIGVSTAGIGEGQNMNLAVSYETIRPFVSQFI